MLRTPAPPLGAASNGGGSSNKPTSLSKFLTPSSGSKLDTAATTVPKLYLCPISLELMQEPTITACGHMFERDAIVDWIRGPGSAGKYCPICHQAVAESQLSPCYPIKAAIAEWVRAQAENQAVQSSSGKASSKVGSQLRNAMSGFLKGAKSFKEDASAVAAAALDKAKSAAATAANASSTMIRPSRSRSASVTSPQEAAYSPMDSLVWARLVPINKAYDSIEINKDSFVIGRSGNADFIISRNEISGRHCNIYRVAMDPSSYGYTSAPGAFNWDIFAVDNSSNGTYVNGKRTGKGEPIGIRHGDEISIGNRFSSHEKPELSSFLDWLYLGLSKSSPLIPSINMIKRTVADFDDLLTMDDDDMITRGIESPEVRMKTINACKTWKDEHQLPVYKFLLIARGGGNNDYPSRNPPKKSPASTMIQQPIISPAPLPNPSAKKSPASTMIQLPTTTTSPPAAPMSSSSSSRPPPIQTNGSGTSFNSFVAPSHDGARSPRGEAPPAYSTLPYNLNKALPPRPPNPLVVAPTPAPAPAVMGVSGTSILSPTIGPAVGMARAVAVPQQADVVTDDDFEVGFFPVTYMSTVNEKKVSLNLRRIGPVRVPLTVYVSTTDESIARSGIDFLSMERVPVTFPVGQMDVKFPFNWNGSVAQTDGRRGPLTVNLAVFHANGDMWAVTDLTEPTAVIVFERKAQREDPSAELARLSLASDLTSGGASDQMSRMATQMATVFRDVNIATIHGVIKHEQKNSQGAAVQQIQDAVVNKLLWYQSLAEPEPDAIRSVQSYAASSASQQAVPYAAAAPLARPVAAQPASSYSFSTPTARQLPPALNHGQTNNFNSQGPPALFTSSLPPPITRANANNQ